MSMVNAFHLHIMGSPVSLFFAKPTAANSIAPLMCSYLSDSMDVNILTNRNVMASKVHNSVLVLWYQKAQLWKLRLQRPTNPWTPPNSADFRGFAFRFQFFCELRTLLVSILSN